MTDLHASASRDSVAIAVENVTRTYGRVRALDGVNLTIRQNTICGLLGSNGAGKTTLMSLIAGHDRPSAGSITVQGEHPFESAVVANHTSFVRDNQRYPDDYVLKHAIGTARIFHPNWSSDLEEQLIKQFDLPLKTPVKKFSRGQLSAIAIIIGLASRAPITIFDEPYLGLDISARRRFYEILLEDYSAHPRTIIISTHLVEEMEAMFDQVVVLHKGRIVLDASPDDLSAKAFEFSGHTAAVLELSEGLNTLSTRTVGSLASTVVLDRVTPELRDRATALGVTLSPAPIHDLVAAIGNVYAPEEEA